VSVVPLRPLKFQGKARTFRAKRLIRHLRVRKRVSGTAERPRLVVFRSSQHIYAQVIDDSRGCTLAAASDLEPALRQEAQGKLKSEVAGLVGILVAQRAVAAGITRVVFDRGGFAYHGRIQILADASRKEGLVF